MSRGLVVGVLVGLAGAGCGSAPPTTEPAAVGAAPAAPAATPAPGGGPPTVQVDPGRLRRGADPRLPWWDARASRLHDGRRSVPVHLPGARGTDVVSLDRAGRAYLLVVAQQAGDRAFRVERSGRVRLLARSGSEPLVLAVATDGRTFARVAQQGPAQATVLVARTSDGHEVARHRFRDEQLRVLALTPRQALVGTYGSTTRWDLASGSVTQVRPDTGLVASRDGRRVVASRTRDDATTSVTGPGTRGAWTLPGRETPQQVSPDGTLLVSGVPRDVDPRGYDVALRPLVVRDTTTGRVRARFGGRFGWYAAGGPRWEDDDHLLVVARDPAYESGQPTVRLAWVRCTVSTRSCTTASPTTTLQLDAPPYGVLPRLVADAPPA